MQIVRYFIVTLFMLFIYFNKSYTQIKSYFAEESLDCIVLLEKKVDTTYMPHGTGFLLYNYSRKSAYNVVTCEHVLRNRDIYLCIPVDSVFSNKMMAAGQDSIKFINQVWFLTGNKLRTRYELEENKNFLSNKLLDIAVFSINISNDAFENDTMKVNVGKTKGVPRSMIRLKKDIPLGTDVYFTGFPLSIGTEHGFYFKGFTGLYSDNIPNPLARKGSVAWKSDFNHEFLLDAFSYGGNSGSPVFTINDIQNKSYLIGMVLGHLPSENSENIGLAKCIWIDNILELIERYNNLK